MDIIGHVDWNCDEDYQVIGPWEILTKFQLSGFQVHFSDWWFGHLSLNLFQVNIFGPHSWWVNIGSGNGLAPSGNKPLPEPVLT